MTEAQQLKLATKKSLQQIHISQASSFGTNEGTGSIPGVPDVPTDESEEEISWNSTDEESADDDDKGDDGEEGNNDDDDDDEQDDDQEDEGNDKDDEEEGDEESFDPILKTPKSTDDESNDEENIRTNTSYTVAAYLSEMELKKIVIEKIEGNKSIHRYNEQRNLYKALVEAYESDKIILDTYGDTVTLKRRRDDDVDKDKEPSAGSNRGSKRCRKGKEPETLVEGEEGALHLGLERPRVYSDLSPEEKDRYNADIRAINILLQGLPKDIYTIINHYTNTKDIWDNVKMLLEGSELTKEDRES
nr:integrase, catalytic region, zinc finger, CCHC-type, peptidase aspartic, catalytic [Tanacetum cinerariifolium]